ncbi:MAG: bifunctional demethylmenaquinone methyltransferase/2-methoxy-6-polyprenyl-1,4-benzoquinol methylase UbiE [Alphaproteobacteria bacterium]|nr:bifunctional demethylmenaquinone methyltransferase/2-methoxy-6-polyprenyl-1,4-benzoquinol methylase UbiE [Alphaproteobacteria bacterium]
MSQLQSVPFGFKDVPLEAKETLVKRVFSSVAEKYDVMNDLMSGGVHRLWKNFMVGQISPRNHLRILDVAGGTGDITFRMHDAFPDASLTLCDINPEMLEVGKKRAQQRHLDEKINWVCGDACQLPFPDGSMDVYTIAFGLRNVTDTQGALNDAFRVLSPGGQFLCLEFSKVSLPFLRETYEKYSFQVIPKIGQMVAGDQEAYQYLVESIARFPDQQTMEAMMQQAGFQNVSHINLAGGIAALHIGWRI